MTFMQHQFDRDPPSTVISRPDLLAHMAELAAEMRSLAHSIEADMLAHHFNCAEQEARAQLRVDRSQAGS